MSKTSDAKKKDYTFADIEKILFRDPDDKSPREIVTDFRLAAGLLFHRYNDDTKRHIRIENGKPTVIITWSASFTAFPRADIPLDPKVVEELFRARAIEGTPEMGYTDMKKLRLTVHGIDHRAADSPTPPAPAATPRPPPGCGPPGAASPGCC